MDVTEKRERSAQSPFQECAFSKKWLPDRPHSVMLPQCPSSSFWGNKLETLRITQYPKCNVILLAKNIYICFTMQSHNFSASPSLLKPPNQKSPPSLKVINCDSSITVQTNLCISCYDNKI